MTTHILPPQQKEELFFSFLHSSTTHPALQLTDNNKKITERKRKDPSGSDRLSATRYGLTEFLFLSIVYPITRQYFPDQICCLFPREKDLYTKKSMDETFR